MAKLVIQPHEHLQEWVAHEKGYFTDAGLEYELTGGIPDDAKNLDTETKKPVEKTTGAFELYAEGEGNKGRPSDISCACHWAVNQSAASAVGRMWGKAYSVTPGAIMVPENSDIRKPEDLAGVEVAVGYHSGSHFATIQALEPFISSADINLNFIGMPWQRADAGIDGDVAATSVWGLSYYVCEQLGMRKIVDTTFMVGFMFPDHVAELDIEKYFDALRSAQMDIDLAPEKYKHYFYREVPERYRGKIDVRRFGPGERIVFLPYSEDTFKETQEWVHSRRLFEAAPDYEYSEVVAR